MAQERAWFGGLKVRSGFQLTSRKDNLAPHMLGFGVEVGREVGVGRLGVELGFVYKPGTQHRLDLGSMPLAQGATVSAQDSVDSRKNQVEGVTLRFGYELPRTWGSYRAGLQVGSLKFRQEYVAQVGDGQTYTDTYNGVVDQGGFSASPFVGVSFPVLDQHALEVSLLGLNYKAAHYVHVAGTVRDHAGGHTGQDHLQTSTRFVPHLEVAFAFRF